MHGEGSMERAGSEHAPHHGSDLHGSLNVVKPRNRSVNAGAQSRLAAETCLSLGTGYVRR